MSSIWLITFRDTTNTYDSLTHYVDRLLGLSFGETTEYPLVQKAQSANTWKGIVALWIWKSQDSWEFDDSQNSNFPIATTTLVNGQRDYSLPTGALTIERVEVRDSAGNYFRIDPIDESEVAGALTGYGESNGIPTRYWIKKRSIFLDSPPDTAQLTASAGIRIYFRREVNEFTGSTTTTEVGFGEPFDRAVAYGMAYDFALPRNMEVLPRLEAGLARWQKLIEDHFSNRFKDKKSGLNVKIFSYI